MKKLKIDLKIVAKGINALNNKLEKLIKSVEGSTKKRTATKKAVTKKKAAKKKAPVKKTAQKATAFDSIVGIIARSKKGVNTDQLKTKTGFDDKKIANIIYKAKNRGLIKSISKGIYTKA